MKQPALSACLRGVWRRRVTKPFYRWSFQQGRRFTDESIHYFLVKYLHKYLRKRQKLHLDGVARIPREELDRMVQTAASVLAAGDGLEEALASLHAQVPEATRAGFVHFAEGLHAACCTNIGLSHAKAREYWIYRGPRQLLTTVCFVAGVVVLNEAIREQAFDDRVVNIATSMLATLTAFVMLYYRLPDSIRSAVCRSAHDYYSVGKKQLAKEVAEARSGPYAGDAGITSHTPSEFDTDNEEANSTPKLATRRAAPPKLPDGSSVALPPSLAVIPSGRESGASDGERDLVAAADAAAYAGDADSFAQAHASDKV